MPSNDQLEFAAYAPYTTTHSCTKCEEHGWACQAGWFNTSKPGTRKCMPWFRGHTICSMNDVFKKDMKREEDEKEVEWLPLPETPTLVPTKDGIRVYWESFEVWHKAEGKWNAETKAEHAEGVKYGKLIYSLIPHSVLDSLPEKANSTRLLDEGFNVLFRPHVDAPDPLPEETVATKDYIAFLEELVLDAYDAVKDDIDWAEADGIVEGFARGLLDAETLLLSKLGDAGKK